MTDSTQTAEQPAATPTGLDRLRIFDVILILAIGLGATRLLGMVGKDLLSGPDAIVDRDSLGIVAVLVAGLAVQAVAFVAAVYFVAIRWRGLAWSDLGFRPMPRRWILGSFVAILVAFPVVGVVNYSIGLLKGAAPHNPQLDMVAPLGFNWPALIAMLVMVGMVVPVAEELFFRGLLYGWLRHRLGVWAAAIISSVCFAVPHGVMWLIPALTILGLVLVFVYQKSGSLWTAALTHGLYNSLTTIFLYTVLAKGLL